MVLKIDVPIPTQLQLRTLLDLSRRSVRFKSKISIRKGNAMANPKSLIEMIALLEAPGQDLEISAEGEDAYRAVRELRELAVGSPV